MTPWRVEDRGSSVLRCAASALLLACCLPAVGCRQKAEEERPQTPVILISLDTVRSDAVSTSATGTPNLARFRSEAVNFSQAYSEIPFTLPAHATMLTGTAPDAHGLFGADDRLQPSQRTLAEILRAVGYRTAAVVSSDWLRPGFGFGRGFDSYEEVPLALTFADEVTRRGMQSLDRIADEGAQPFLFLHYYDAHSDFEVAGNARPYFASAGSSSGLVAECRRALCAPDGACATGFLLWANHHASEVTAAQRQCLAASYEAGVADVDAAFGRLRQELETRGLYDNALIAVTSDHGEEFGEHGQFIHAQPFVESLAIPLWIKLPSAARAGTVVRRGAQLADLVPSLLGRLGLAAPRGMTGEDLLSSSTPLPDERLILGQNKYRPQRYSAQRGRWKLIHDFVEDRSSLFDLDDDAAEVRDVAAGNRHIVAELLAALEARRSELQLARQVSPDSKPAGEEVLSSEARRRLEALGYID